jgi:hypothetical protein
MSPLPPEQLAQVEEGLALLLRGHQRLNPLDPDDEPEPFRALIWPNQERVRNGPRHGEPCPHCGFGEKLRVLRTRPSPGGKLRRVQCLACSERFTTWQPSTPSP